ncbi:C2 calcium-dependent membrane targeting protein [Lasiodiplodia theobromae]|uniref:C2 calcium-dependent membrane targeting protein n=1 Tax=Lasiodiplodia theobromae TaxID=45133 RepID=UPI0015C30816|nr:C2 calcium-dependent membrane targeting protein [Lasiodiplodia theobromae]KAF4535435.1 C2 calcium-dependent membrane targeting protein [Lasiodiplodia theobromae]
MAASLAQLTSTPHTNGIYSDMTVDGPEIGTLVAVVDRAKNLPNRKTMGKQDPYCAARLGKEAKKTETDKRGGQTPRWDQELRFTVRDSPDYYQMKVSVFNDDKKTELIGETFIRLDEVIVPGGGQSDTWHGLLCKGKYAGEVRLELTYYDTRLPVERPVAEKRREHAPVKRRPLPTNPAAESPIVAAEIPPPSKNTRVFHTPPYQQHTLRPSRSTDSAQSGLPFSPDDYDVFHHRPADAAQPDELYAQHYPVQPIAPPQQTSTHARHLSMVPQRGPGHDSRARPLSYMDVPHSHSAPVVPTSHGSPEALLDRRTQYPPEIPPLNDYHPDSSLGDFYPEQDQQSYPAYGAAYRMSRSAMQPTVEDEDDAAPPPPPMHRSSAPASVPQVPEYSDMTPPPLNVGERRHTHPHAPSSPAAPPYSGEASARPSSHDDPFAVPSALVPGGASADPRMSIHQHRMSVSAYPPSANGYGAQQAYPTTYGTPPRQQYQLEYHTPPRGSPTSHPQSYSGTPQDSVALVKPHAVSPVSSHYDVRQSRMANRSTPGRKSVSPRPPTSDGSRAPYGPDSFESYNPRASPRNPTQARDMDINGRDEHGNIVTPDGRKIDPSDHLPIDSWAPEPEPKGRDRDRKPPTRERDRLNGAREIGSRHADRAIRDAVAGTFGGGMENSPSPTSGTRRLQKRNMQPLRERENFGGYGSSPGGYAAHSGPPIPAKVPLNDGMGAEDLSALSEELKGIDIGATPASTRGRWRRRG